jgi:hypothetical protein
MFGRLSPVAPDQSNSVLRAFFMDGLPSRIRRIHKRERDGLARRHSCANDLVD